MKVWWGFLVAVVVPILIGTTSAAAQSCGPLACSEILVDLPYQLDFESDHGKIVDQNGVGTGFTYVDPPTNGTGYIPQNLLMDTAAGELQLTTTAGLSLTNSNSLDNGLAVGIDAPSQVTRIEATINDPPAGTGNFEQAGIWFGNDEDNYFKLDITSTSSGTSLQYYKEIGGVVIQHATSPILDLDGHSVTLTLIADPDTKEIEASYQVDDGPRQVLTTVAVPEEFFSFDGARIDPEIGTDSFGGIYASHGSGPAAVRYDFGSFSVTKERDVARNPLTEGIAFRRTSFPIPNPTSIALGPDGRLYVTELMGTIHALTLDDAAQVVDDQVIDALGTRLTLGITVDPASTPDNVVLWVAHSDPAFSGAPPNSSVVSRLSGVSGPGPILREDLITGLPRSFANHSTNSLHFGPDGRLYIAQGGNTGAGAPNSSDSEFGSRAEQPLSAALLVADVYAPGFDGSCSNESDIYGPAPCDVQPYATGLRNSYDFVFHSNDRIYSPDNGLGVTGTFPPSPTPPCLDFGDPALYPDGQNPGTQPDELNILEQGAYYGHPDPYRDECVFGDGQMQGVPPLFNYHAPVWNLGDHKSADGIIEYTSSAHCGALKGDLLITNYSSGDDVSRIELGDDGQSVVDEQSLVGGFDDPLPIAQGPDGTIYVGEFGAGQVTALAPINIGCWTGRAPLPADLLDAGGTALGGELYVVGGKDADAHRSAMYVYNPARDSWNTGPDLPGLAVENPAVTAYDGKLYVFGGSTSAFSGAVSTTAVFDPATNRWTPLAAMPTARGGPTAKAIGGDIYVAGGMDSDGASLSTVEVFDPSTGEWESAPSMSTRRDNPGSAVLDGQLYVFGGRTRDADGTEVNGTLATVEMYDPATDSWTPRASMPTGRRTMAVGTLNGRAQLMGGERKPSPPGTFPANEEYDPDTDTWRTLNPMPTPRHGAAAGTIGGVVYVVGGGSAAGSSFVPVNEAFSFNPFVAPGVTTGDTSSEGETTATLTGTVNPKAQATIYHFEYGTDMSYGSSAPLPDGDAGSASSDQPVSASIAGLGPDTVYHYRLVASNGSGTTVGADESFQTPAASGGDHRPPVIRIRRNKIKLSRSGVGHVWLRCPASEPDPSCVGHLGLVTAHRVWFRASHREVMLGRRDFNIPSGETRRLSLRLPPSKRQLVTELGRLRVKATAAAHDLAGNKGASSYMLTMLAPWVRLDQAGLR
jgi:glucose/arabinose dehydrogenase/N-acetylneuraminic acid mutarotase